MNPVRFALALAFATSLLLAAAFEPVHAEPWCAKEGRDCVENLKQGGKMAYCQWAAQMAVVGAYARDNMISWTQTEDRTDVLLATHMKARKLTDNEKTHIAKWLWFGWSADANVSVLDIQNRSYDVCAKGFL